MSFGYSSSYEDADVVLRMVRESFVSGDMKLDTSWLEKVQRSSGDQLANGLYGLKVANERATVMAATVSPLREEANSSRRPYTLTVTDVTLYPVKSCGALSVSSWQYGSSGLVYDRMWMVMSTAGYIVTLKRQPKMGMIVPSMDLVKGTLTLSYEGISSYEHTLEYSNWYSSSIS